MSTKAPTVILEWNENQPVNAERGKVSGTRWGAGFTAVGRFVAEVDAAATGTGVLRPGYVLVGDEVFCRTAAAQQC